MNILILNTILYTADGKKIPEVKSIKDTMIYGMCLGFVLNGHHVTLAGAEDYKPVAEEEYDFEVLFFKSALVRIFKPTLLPLSSALYRYLKRNHVKYDVIVSSEVFSLATLFAAMICPSKTVVWQELTAHQRKFKRIPSKIWHKVIVPVFFGKVRCVIPRSKKAYTFIRKYMKNVSSEVVDHGINLSNFGFSKEKERQLISSSQLIYRKNVESIVWIYSRLVKIKGYEDVKLLIAGRGEQRQLLEDLVLKLNLQDSVSFLEFLSQRDLNNVIKKSYAFLINTRRDLNMVSIPEAIVSGTPVVTNLIPTSSDYIIKERLGIAKDNWDETDLMEIIDNNPSYVDNCVNYREKLTNSHCAKKITDIYLGYNKS
jgi:1,2-diacylglycerol 3-alpha-glucosyltransferase